MASYFNFINLNELVYVLYFYSLIIFIMHKVMRKVVSQVLLFTVLTGNFIYWISANAENVPWDTYTVLLESNPVCESGKRYAKINISDEDGGMDTVDNNIWFWDYKVPVWVWFELPANTQTSSHDEWAVFTYDWSNIKVDLLKKSDNKWQHFAWNIEFYWADLDWDLTRWVDWDDTYNLEIGKNHVDRFYSTDWEYWKIINFDFANSIANDEWSFSIKDKIVNCQKWSVDWYVFDDNNDGWWWNETEDWLNGWTINLETNNEWWKSFSWLSHTNWYFSFSDVPFGNYTLCEGFQEWWNQTYPDRVAGCHELSINSTENFRYYFGNHFTWTWTNDAGTWSIDTWTWETESGTWIIDTGTWIVDSGTWSTNTWTWEWDFESGTSKIIEAIRINKIYSTWPGGWRKAIKKIISLNVDETIESSWISWSIDNEIVNIYNEYLKKLNRLSDIKHSWNKQYEQEKTLIQNYIEWTYVSTKNKMQIDNVIKKLIKSDLDKRKVLIAKVFTKLSWSEEKFKDNSTIMNLISYLKLKLAVAYSEK